MRFSYSLHAEEVMRERGLSPEWVERTVLSPDAVEIDPMHPDRRRAFAAIPERGGRILRVVYVLTGDSCRVVTAFLDRGRKR